MNQDAQKYRHDIDGLRALAVMPVLLYHFGVNQISGGFAGVDVFFVISGYLIAGSILNDLQKNRFSLSNFYWRRSRRILPALVVVVFLSTIAAYFLLPAGQLVGYAWSVLATMTFWSNIYFWHATDYFAVSADLTPLLHTWSLSVEEQYYLIAPIAMYLIYRFAGSRWLLVMVPLALGSFALSWYGLYAGPRFTFYWLPTRAWELMLGAMLMLAQLPRVKSRALAEAVGLAGLACLAVAYFTLDKNSMFPGPGAILPCLGAALLIYAGQQNVDGHYPLATRLLEQKPFVWIGLLSYSLYLVHWPLISFATHFTLNPVSAPVLLTAISLLLAAALWKWVEQPFRRSPTLSAKRPVFISSFVAIAVSVSISAVAIFAQGLPGRSADYVRQDVETVPWRNGQCFFQQGQRIANFSIEECTHDLGYDDAKILLWGDSYAAQYVAGLEANAERLGSNVVQINYAGCPPILDYRSAGIPECAAFNQKVRDLIQKEDFSVIILAALWDIQQTRTVSQLAATLNEIKAEDRKIIVIGQSPRFIDDVQRISASLAKKGVDATRHSVEFSKQKRDLLVEQTAIAQVSFLDPMSLLCVDHVCPLSDEVDFYAFDEGHMTKRGASVAINAYLDSLLPPDATLVSETAVK